MNIIGAVKGLFNVNPTEPIHAIGQVFDDLFTSDEERLQAQAVLRKLDQHPAELQAAINKIEASHRSLLVAGWRPAIGWVCALSLASYFIPQYLAAAYVWTTLVMSMTDLSQGLPPFPATSSGLFELTLALLGMGTIRMAEKLAGKAR